jgi:hypothetical protein
MKKNKIITLGVLIMSTTVFSGTEIDALKDRITKLETVCLPIIKSIPLTLPPMVISSATNASSPENTIFELNPDL